MTETGPDRKPWVRLDTLALIAITIAGGALRFIRLTSPGRTVFDEAFYARDACRYLGRPLTACPGTSVGEVHPPLAKWIMAAGVRAFDSQPLGWRIGPAVVGTLTIAVMYVLARKLLGATVPAAAATLLLALDPQHFVLSRVGMLDAFVVFFTLGTFALLVYERDRMIAPGRPPPPTSRYRVAAGVVGGLAMASKWSGAFVVVAGVVLCLVWAAARESGQARDRLGRALRREGPSLLLCFVLVPTLVYSLTFVGRVHGDVFANPAAEGSWPRAFVDKQLDMASFHQGAVSANPVESRPWTWPLIKRPIPYYADRSPKIVEVWFGGSPIIWWASLVALGWAAITWARRRSPSRPEGAILAGFCWAYLPWFALTIPPFTLARQMVFIYYLAPAVPFMCLAVAWAVDRLAGSHRRVMHGLVVALAVATFAYFYPVMAAVPIDRAAWGDRSLFKQCTLPPPWILTQTLQTPGGEPTLVTGTIQPNDPPAGWCWR